MGQPTEQNGRPQSPHEPLILRDPTHNPLQRKEASKNLRVLPSWQQPVLSAPGPQSWALRDWPIICIWWSHPVGQVQVPEPWVGVSAMWGTGSPKGQGPTGPCPSPLTCTLSSEPEQGPEWDTLAQEPTLKAAPRACCGVPRGAEGPAGGRLGAISVGPNGMGLVSPLGQCSPLPAHVFNCALFSPTPCRPPSAHVVATHRSLWTEHLQAFGQQ